MVFFLHPTGDILPPFLAGYRPHAIAIDPLGGGIVIEVRRDRRPCPDKHLAELAKTVAAQSGWKFRAIYTNPAAEQPDRIAKPTPAQIDAGLQEIKALAEGGIMPRR